MDPLSITTSLVTLLGMCIQVTQELKKVRHGIAATNSTIIELLTEVGGFRNILQSMHETCNKVEANSIRQAPSHIGNHWQNISKSLRDGQTVLDDLLSLLQRVNKRVFILARLRKYLRYKALEDQITQCRGQVRSQSHGLQLSLQTIVMWNQISIKESTDQIPKLVTLSREIGRMAIKINKRLERLANMEENVPDAQVQAEGIRLANLQACIRSCAPIISTASTILGHSSTSACESNLALAFAPQPNELTLRWMDSPPAFGLDGPNLPRPPDVAIGSSLEPELSTEQHQLEIDSDPDADLEVNIANAYLKCGESFFRMQNYIRAEESLRNCLSRFAALSDSYSNPQEVASDLLFSTLLEQKKFSEVRSEIQKKLSSGPRVSRTDPNTQIRDMSLLVDTLMMEGNLLEAQLYARLLLIQHRKNGNADLEGVELTLKLLIRICLRTEKIGEADEYASVLLAFMYDHPESFPDARMLDTSDLTTRKDTTNDQYLSTKLRTCLAASKQEISKSVAQPPVESIETTVLLEKQKEWPVIEHTVEHIEDSSEIVVNSNEENMLKSTSDADCSDALLSISQLIDDRFQGSETQLDLSLHLS